MNAFTLQFQEFYNQTLSVLLSTRDAFGGVNAGTGTGIPCYTETSSKIVKDTAGREVSATIAVFTDDNYSLGISTHVFTIGAVTNKTAVSIEDVRDTDGVIVYQIVYL